MKRIDWIDALKGFGIFCVTLGHLACNYLLETHIYSFHMFLFFFLSGFLHNNAQGSLRVYLAKKSTALLIPFLLWNLMSCLIGLFFNYTVSETIRLFFLLDGIICWNAPIWFLLQLFMVGISFFIIDEYMPYGKYLSIPVLFVLWYFISGYNVFLKLNILPVCLLFYIFGNIVKQFYDNCSKAGNKTHIYIYIYSSRTIIPLYKYSIWSLLKQTSFFHWRWFWQCILLLLSGYCRNSILYPHF